MKNKADSVKKFTAKYIRSLVCPPHLKQQYVAILPDVHLYISVGKAGNKAFCFRCKQNKIWKILDLNCKFDDSIPDALARSSLLEAQSRAAEVTARRNRGENVFEQTQSAANIPTVQDLFEHYKVEHLEKSGKRIVENSNNFKRWFIKRKLGIKNAIEFSHEDASKLHKQMEKTPGSANRAVQLGRAMFNFGIKTRFITRADNPFSGVTLYPENQRDRVLSDAEAGRLIQAISDAPLKHCQERTIADLIMLWLLTGVRKTVMLSMEWSEVKEENWLWTIPATKMKGRKMQEILLGPAEIEILAKRKQMLTYDGKFSKYVFPSEKSASGHIEDPGNAWESLREKVGLKDLWIHDLRRSLASAMANSGASVAIVKQTLAHTDERTTMRAYIRTNRQAQLEARQKAQEGWFEASKKIRDD
ncbi:MAG: tyrosine-type recombinase/integrase [Candidatus Melainabacteria bacterium]|nr:tyrosine-type recombinase/integrase [Candidatus Melainabacteria bacterium]